MDEYAIVSGQACSKIKSRVYYGSGTKQRVKAYLHAKLGFTVGTFPTDYLGVPIFDGTPKLGYSIVERLRIPHSAHAKLIDKVGDFLRNGIWSFMLSFVRAFPEVLNDILHHHMTPGEDKMIWSKSLHVNVTERLARLHTRVRFPSVRWDKWIWSSYIPMRRSLIVWRLLLSRLPTMDTLHRFIGPMICFMCRGERETFDHLFWRCSLAVKASIVMVVWDMWTFQNKAIYENLRPSPFILINTVRMAMREMQFMGSNRGYMRNDINDLLTLKALKVSPHPSPSRNLISVVWRPPPTGWIKINIDGSAQAAPGVMTT
ncbi:hypothetical protein C2S51_024460 [Perilla frutescens var. frutescens]|nr:hypothetical protein C2S51_024460 [Perilla frutescens var. frutescens]